MLTVGREFLENALNVSNPTAVSILPFHHTEGDFVGQRGWAVTYKRLPIHAILTVTF
jgi:hypothetical protein